MYKFATCTIAMIYLDFMHENSFIRGQIPSPVDASPARTRNSVVYVSRRSRTHVRARICMYYNWGQSGSAGDRPVPGCLSLDSRTRGACARILLLNRLTPVVPCRAVPVITKWVTPLNAAIISHAQPDISVARLYIAPAGRRTFRETNSKTA